MDSVELQLKLQAFQFSLDGHKDDIKELETSLQTQKSELEKFKDESKNKSEFEKLTKAIEDTNTKLKNEYLSYKSVGKNLLFLASMFGAVQILFSYLSRFFGK